MNKDCNHNILMFNAYHGSVNCPFCTIKKLKSQIEAVKRCRQIAIKAGEVNDVTTPDWVGQSTNYEWIMMIRIDDIALALEQTDRE